MEDSQKPWSDLASSSLLLKAVASWRADPEEWLEGAFDRLPETVRVNPLRRDSAWVEQWLKDVGAHRICLLYTSPSPRDGLLSRMPSSA